MIRRNFAPRREIIPDRTIADVIIAIDPDPPVGG